MICELMLLYWKEFVQLTFDNIQLVVRIPFIIQVREERENYNTYQFYFSLS